MALVGAICAEPELLVLDEPTSGLDPIVRREFIQTVIGAYQEADPGNRTVFVSTHLISEFEGLIDEFTIIENGREELTLNADEARSRYKKIRARFAGGGAGDDFPGGQTCPARGPGAGTDGERPLGRNPETAPGTVARSDHDGDVDAGGDLRGGVEVMGGTMTTRLIKETRDLLPVFMGAVLLVAVPYAIWPSGGFGYFALGVACVLMAAALLALSSSTGQSRCCSHSRSPGRCCGGRR